VRERTRGLLGDDWARPGVLVLLAVALPLLGEATGILTNSRATAIGAGVIFVIAGLSLNVLTGYTGQLSLGHWALVGVGAFTSAKVTAPVEMRLPWIVGVFAAVVVGAAVGFLLGLPSMRIRGLYLAIATVAFHFAMEFSLFASDIVSNGSAGAELPRPYIGSKALTSDPQYLVLMALVLVAVVVVDSNLTSTRVGRSFQAVRADEDIAASFGIDVRRAKLLAFTVSGAYAGAAGALYGHLYQFANASSFRFDTSLLLVAIVVIGGLGSRVGVIVAGAFFGLAPIINEVIFGEAAESWDLIIGAVALLATIAFHPEGLAGTIRERKEHREEKEARRHAAEHVDDVVDETMPALPSLPRPTGLPERRVVDGAVLEAQDVTVDFGGLRAVDHATIRVPRNRIVGLIGPNGAGKTTMFNAISGAIAATHGTIRFNGTDVGPLRADQRAALGLARTFQSLGLARDRSVTENLLLAQHLLATYPLPSALGGIGPSQRIESELRDRARQTLDALGFEQFADTPVRNLSGGQQRIVEIAAALLTAPELVMLDEPSAGMAPAAVENLAVRLREMRDDLGRTILLIEHNIPLVADVCDEVYVMDAGAIIAHGTPADALSDPAVITAYLGEGAAT
jgi:branched-chain amino acid transport system permease protein